MWKRNFLLIFTCIIFAGNIFGQDKDMSKKITVKKLAENLYKLTFNPEHKVNIVVSAGKNGILIADAAFNGTKEELLEVLEQFSNSYVKYIINTHWHPDRTVLNRFFGNDIEIISHERSRERSSADQHIGEYLIERLPSYALPGITFTEKMQLHFNGELIDLIAIPGGHSDSDVIVYFKTANVLYLSDLLFSESFPYIDIDHGANVKTYINNLKIIINSFPDDVLIIAGHGKDYNKNDLIKYFNMLQETVEIVLKETKTGKSLQQLKNENILNSYNSWGKFFETVTPSAWIEMIYRSYAQK